MFDIAHRNQLCSLCFHAIIPFKHMSTWSVSLHTMKFPGITAVLHDAWHTFSWTPVRADRRLPGSTFDVSSRHSTKPLPMPDSMLWHAVSQSKQNTKWKSGVSSLYPSNGPIFFRCTCLQSNAFGHENAEIGKT